ncbi:hypothetical protein BS78_K340600 [Paspalum vaginatum]|uniref:Uncharacterized protein n=1 Tax=Paspalum vaginatum TaxID=158149 RepID=A0A9W7X9X9_9POAL|nr:hypothetical protein BS78_K340600 [Paspalum vaginatum]
MSVRKTSQCPPRTSPSNVARHTLERAQMAHEEFLALCNRKMSFNNKHVFWRDKSFTPSPPIFLSSQRSSPDTKHWPPVAVSVPNQRKPRRRRSTWSTTPGGRGTAHMM